MENLPNDVLLRILSHGSTKHSVSTSLMSRRFRNVWKYMEMFDFRGDSRNYALLTGFLNNTFLQEFTAPDLKYFALTLLAGDYNPDHIRAWIEFVISRNINDLYFDCGIPGLIIPLPIAVFTCNSLKNLQLERGSNVLNVPSNGSLPLLKRLDLVNTRDLSADSLQNILDISPSLKIFRLDCFANVGDAKSYTVFSNSVERLFVSYGGLIQKLSVKTPCLKIMSFDNDIDLFSAPELSFGNMPELAHAQGSFGDAQLTSFIGAITSTTKLTLCSSVGIRYPHAKFTLPNLETLELCTCNNGRVDIYALLQASPNVRVLNLFEYHGHPDNMSYSPPVRDFAVPQRTLDTLQILDWSNFTCCPTSMHILRALLMYGTALQKVDITFPDDLPNAAIWQANILAIPLAANHCAINVHMLEFPEFNNWV